MTITFWGADRPNGYLSNFFLAEFTVDGVLYPTTEHYFQSKKFEGTIQEQYILQLKTPKDTAREGKRRDFPLRKDWELVKEDVMRKALRAKFTQNISLLERLLKTGDHKLIENSPFDSYWGVGRDKKGQNRLGCLLEELREELKKERI